MLAAAEAGEFDELVCYKQDRLARDTKRLFDIVDRLDKAGVSIETVSGDFNTTTSSGRMTMQMLSSLAEMESTQKSERQLDTIAHLRGPRCRGHIN